MNTYKWKCIQCSRYVPMECQREQNPLIMDIHNSIMDIHKSIWMSMNNSIMDIHKWIAFVDIHNS